VSSSSGGRSIFTFYGHRVRLGETADLELPVSQMYTGEPVHLPVRIIRGKRRGPTVFLTAAIHGDEINGVGIIRQFLFDEKPRLESGTLICAPVVNVFGFENNDREMPDGRDLNRCFPGSATGSLAGRFAHQIMQEIVAISDVGFDLHSAGATRTNYPNVRGDLRNAKVREIAGAIGCELVVNGPGPEGSLRRAACDAGCPTVILEAGEVSKFEPLVQDVGVRGIENLLIHLGMRKGRIIRPAYQATIHRTTWVRAEIGGLLRFHVSPGELVGVGQPLATSESIFGEARSVIISPADGIVLGMATHPAVKPGEPVCHIALPGRQMPSIRRVVAGLADHSPECRLRDDLATSFSVTPGPDAVARAVVEAANRQPA